MRQNFCRAAIEGINKLLSPLNLRLDSLTASRLDLERLRQLDKNGAFARSVYPIPDCFHKSSFHPVLDELANHQSRFDTFLRPELNDVGFSLNNEYFSSPDAEVLYALVRLHRPARILEIGCGNSTRIIRQAIRDGQIPCNHTCVDPHPRNDIGGFADVIIAQNVESLCAAELAAPLKSGDFLFIDTSHEVKPANDVAFLYCDLLPRTASGVIVHVHDIFLPYDYPAEFVFDCGNRWGEQYILQAMLASNPNWEVLWPGFYLQQTLPDFSSHFPLLKKGLAQSFWMRKSASQHSNPTSICNSEQVYKSTKAAMLLEKHELFLIQH